MKAVIMAGGFGTRIQPLTHSTPKPMLPVMNIPMMEKSMHRLKEIGINEFVVLLFYKPEVIKNYFGTGEKFGFKIHYVQPDADYGTAGAVGYAREFLDEPFIVMSGDVVCDFDLKKIIEFHKNKKSKLTITLTSVENPLEFGIVIVDEEGKIERFLEKPSWGEVFSDTINTGIYVIEPEILDFIPKNEPFDFSKNLFPTLMSEGITLYGYEAKGYWRDVGNPDSYREVHKDIFDSKVNYGYRGKKVEFPEGVLYTEDGYVPEGVEIIDTVVIGKNVKIEKGCRLHNVVIGDNSKIDKECKLKNTIIWHDVKIGKGVIFDNVVVCNNVKVGDFVKAKVGAVIAEGCKIGKFAIFEQDVTVWPNKEIEPASIVTNNVIWGEKYKNAIFKEGIAVGKTNVEIDCEMSCRLGEAFASILPEKAKIIVARDNHPSSRMLKRAFVGGVLSDGIDILDLKDYPMPLIRNKIANDEEIKGGVYFRQSVIDPSEVEIFIFNEEGLRISKEEAKAIEKNFFKEKFRRVDYKEIGNLYDDEGLKKKIKFEYLKKIKNVIDHKIIKANIEAIIDLMWGMGKDIYPDVLKELELENLLLNNYYDQLKLTNFSHFEKESKENMSTLVKCLESDVGFLIYPHCQRLNIVADDGKVLDKIEGLMCVLYLFDLEAKSKEIKFKVFLPVWAPDILDEKFKNLEIERGKYSNFSAKKFKKYDLIATLDGNFAFTEFALHRDAIFASLKIMELLSRHTIKLSEIEKNIESFYYRIFQIPCPQTKKGYVMKKFIKYAKEHNSNYTNGEGVKIYESDDEWVLMIPDMYSEEINLFVQAEDEIRGDMIYKKYEKLLKEWIG
ncbi:sugar phosphate nucleotidyltransferase [Caminibacter sp.]